MQTKLADFVKTKPDADELEQILRTCVHCGFCNATCPTYQLTGNELDGPRGRIYLLKQMLEGHSVSNVTHYHLDRCLSCRSCETTCPSGVRYARLLDLGKHILNQRKTNQFNVRFKKFLMRQTFSRPQLFTKLMRIAAVIRPMLPFNLRNKIPAVGTCDINWPESRHDRKMLILNHCVQDGLAPAIDRKTAQILDKLSISLVRVKASTCCGALNYHLSGHQAALEQAKQNIDACWPLLEQGAEAIVSSASGCGLMLKEYGQLLQFDQNYSEKAAKFSAMTFDISEILSKEDLSQFKNRRGKRITFHSPCTLQHGQQLAGVVEALLQKLGYHVNAVANGHLCCGSAGVYSLLQPEMAQRLRSNKILALQKHQADFIVTANIGCLTHLNAASDKPIRHWVELLD